MKDLPFAPSVQMQETPRNPMNHRTTIEGTELSDDEDSDLDERITRKCSVSVFISKSGMKLNLS